MNAEKRAAIRAYISEASPAPWSARAWSTDERFTDIESASGQLADMVEGVDAEFIANARTDLPAALDTIDAVLALHPTGHWTTIGDLVVPQPHPIAGVTITGCSHCLSNGPCATVRAIEGATPSDASTGER